MGILRIVTLLSCLGAALSCTSTGECTSECYSKLTEMGCQGMLSTMSEVLKAQNVTQYCSMAEAYQMCVDNTFVNCDPSLNKSTFTGGMGETYRSLCKGSPVDMCRMKVAICSQYMPQDANAGMPGCGPLKQYLDCVKGKMKTCDPSVTIESVIGPLQTSYNMQCSAPGGASCPGIQQCMASLMGSDSNQANEGDDAPVDIVKDCNKMETMLSCLQTEHTNCKGTMERSYSFGQVAKLYNDGCKVMSSNSDVLTCDQFKRCMTTLKFPTEPKEVAKLTSDPQVWCSMIKSMMECSSKSPECKSDRSDFISSLQEVNKVCPEADVLVTTEGSASGIYPGLLTVFITGLAALLTNI